MDTAPLPTTIHIENDEFLTTQAYSVLKLTAIAELEEATTKGKKSINTAVTKATNTAIAELKNEYESTLTEWDTTKITLDLETKQAILDIQNALDESSQVTENVSQITKDLEATKQDVKLLDKSVDMVVEKAKNTVTHATKEATNTAVTACSKDLLETNKFYIADMDTVFSENMGLMQDLQSSFDPTAALDTATTASIRKIDKETTAFTTKALLNLKKEYDTLSTNSQRS